MTTRGVVMKVIKELLKRGLDLVVSIPFCIVLLPILSIIALIIRIDSPGSPLYIQERVGKNKKLFKAFKLRTMYKDSSINNYAAPKKNDKRVTRVGHVLRVTSVDELPQIFNVLIGDMSLVGPRAVPPVEIELRLHKLIQEDPDNEEMYKSWMNIRSSVKPGITGMAQANGRSDLTVYQATKYDVEYAESYSFAGDIRIIFKTAINVIKRKGTN